MLPGEPRRPQLKDALGRVDGHASATRKAEKDAADDQAVLLANLARDCEALQPGRVSSPPGWSDDRKGHLLLAVVARGGVPGGWAGDDQNACSVAVIGGGGGATGLYHVAPRSTTGSFMRRTALTLQGTEHVSHAACWFVLLRPLLRERGPRACQS